MARPRLDSRARFLAAAACRPVDHPPLWMMRQAGRCLPEYRKLKEQYDFVTMVSTPDLAAEVTLQPIRRFGFDAAIIFSDILVVPEALGMSYRFEEGKGIRMQFAVGRASDLKKLSVRAVADRLAYLGDALRLVRYSLPDTALLGFAGSPWSLAHYMVEGGGGGPASDCAGLKCLRHANPVLFRKLMGVITDAVIASARLQVDAGIDAFQVFDSFGGALAATDWEECSGRWIRRIVQAIKPSVPVIVFARGAHGSLPALAATGASVIGFDWSADLADCARRLPGSIAVQGNLDPALLLAPPRTAAAATRCLLASMRGRRGHIVNLGHGVPPTANLGSIAAIVETVRGRR